MTDNTITSADICSDCMALVASLHDRIAPMGRGWKTVPDLITSWDTCTLCKFIGSSATGQWGFAKVGDSLLVLYGPEGQDGPFFTHDDDEGPIQAGSGVNVHQQVSELNMTFCLRGYEETIIFAVWLEPCFSQEMNDDDDGDYDDLVRDIIESYPSGLSREAGLTAESSPEAYALFRSWLHQCKSGHGLGESEEYTSTLPTRILDIGSSPGADVKLVETAGTDLQEPYVALSHCWGPEDRRPIRTTKANLQEHLAGIPHNTLPKTFREAIEIVREMDCRLIWIDSLCIIQDDAADWAHEANRMGTVYENAHLTIAACAAHDSTQGCFTADRTDSKTLKIKTTLPADGTTAVKVCFSAEPKGQREPYYSHLGSRAWVVQEWYLSRRVLFCTAGGYSWKCRHVQVNERSCYYDMHEKRAWEWVLQRYSQSHLTYEKDRLVALQGMATALQSTKKGEFRFGAFTGDLPQMLFWMMRDFPPPRDGAPYAPSWSWASRLGCKQFWPTAYWFFQRSVKLTEGDMVVDDAGQLSFSAPLQQVGISPFPMNEDRFRDAAQFSPEAALLLVRATGNDDTSAHFIHNTTTDFSQAVGLAVFDEIFEQLPDNISIISFLAAPRLDADPLWTPSYDGKMQPGWDTSEDVIFEAIWRDADGKEQEFRGDIHNETRFATAKQLRESPERYELKKPNGMLFIRRRSSYSADVEGQGWSINRETTWRTRQIDEGSEPEGSQEAVEYVGGGSAVHWVLLVIEVEGQPDTFRRIGMGVVSSLVAQDELRHIHLV